MGHKDQAEKETKIDRADVESVVSTLEAIERKVEDLDERVQSMEADDTADEAEPDGENTSGFSRRGLLGAGTVGLFGAGMTGSASAASGSIGTPTNPVDVYADTLSVSEALGVAEVDGYDGDRIALGDPDSSVEFMHLDRADESVVFPDASLWYRGNDLNDVGAIDHSGLTGGERLESLVGPNLAITNDNELTATSGGGSADGNFVSVTEYGAEGDGTTDDTQAFNDALNAASNADGAVFLPAGEYVISDPIGVPEEVTVRGAGQFVTTIRSEDSSNQNTIYLESKSELRDFTLDQNASGRGHDSTTGVMMQECDNCHIDRVRFVNISESWEGVGIYLSVNEDHSQDTFDNRISRCYVEGNWSDEDLHGDFLIRARTPFNADLADDEYTRFLRDNTIENCLFTGECKSAIELVGPATRHNRVVDCMARNVETCIGVFEASLGAKNNLFEHCLVKDCTANSSATGFYSDGRTPIDGRPERRSEDNTFADCHVDNFSQIYADTPIRGFRTRRDDRAKFIGCRVSGLETPDGTSSIYERGWEIDRSSNVVLQTCSVSDAGTGIYFNDALLPRINTPHLHNVDDLINANGVDRPRWNGVLGGGAFGGVNLANEDGYYPGDKAMSDGSNAEAYLEAVWTGSAWKPSDGGSTI